MSSRFVITKKTEDGDSLSQLARNLLLQLIVSYQWTTKFGDIKRAFLEADVQKQMADNPVFADLPPGGVPGVEKVPDSSNW